MNVKTIFISVLCSLLLLSPLFAGVADYSPKNTIVIVNSQSYEDVIAASVYSAQNGYTLVFILTESHGKYWESLLTDSSDNIKYYESSTPVYPSMRTYLSSLSKTNIEITKSDTLANEFANFASSNKAIIVGKNIGAEAISAAPYAVITKAGLYFADESNADLVVTNLIADKKDVLIYGSIADSVSIQTKESVDVIDINSVYLDNLELLSMYSELQKINQLVFVSGKSFESAMVSPDYPIAIVGRTEPSQGLLELIFSSGAKNGLVFSGDSDISGAVASIKKETGLPVFAKLGQGFVGDSQMQPLAIMSVPSRDVVLTVNSVQYLAREKQFELEILNPGKETAYVRATAMLPTGKLGSTNTFEVATGAKEKILISLEASTSAGVIDEASFQIYSGSDQYVVESIDVITFTDIKVKDTGESLSLVTNYTNSATDKYVKEQGGMAFSAVIALILMLVAAYLFMHHSKPGSHVVLSKGSHRHNMHKKTPGGRKRRK